MCTLFIYNTNNIQSRIIYKVISVIQTSMRACTYNNCLKLYIEYVHVYKLNGGIDEHNAAINIHLGTQISKYISRYK